MRGAVKLWAVAFFTTLAATPVAAADLAPPPSFYVHAGALGVFFQTNAQPTGGGLFPTTNITLPPVYTLALEVGYFVTPNIAIALSTGVPPLVHFKAETVSKLGVL